MPTATVNGTSIFYRQFGDAERPTLVLVHGLYGESSSLTGLAERFASRFNVIVPDAIGHGRSEHPASFTLEDQGRMLNALPAAIGIEPGALVGISMGSYLSGQAAVLAPSLWSHLVLVVGKAQGVTSSVAAYAARVGLDLSGATQEEMVALMSDAPCGRPKRLRIGARRSWPHATRMPSCSPLTSGSPLSDHSQDST